MGESDNKALLVGDSRGLMGILNPEDLPFAVQRLFWLTNVRDGESRGGHAHRSCEQLIVCASGTVTRVTESKINGITTQEMQLGDTYHLKTMTWLTLDNFSEDCVVLVLASEPYDESEYIRDHYVFTDEISQSTP